jgi:hypothetical protein
MLQPHHADLRLQPVLLTHFHPIADRASLPVHWIDSTLGAQRLLLHLDGAAAAAAQTRGIQELAAAVADRAVDDFLA